MIQQLSRFNPQPMAGYRYVGVYVGQQYIAGPQNQAYTATTRTGRRLPRLSACGMLSGC